MGPTVCPQAGQDIVCKAAIAWAAKEPLDIVDVKVAPPKRGEVNFYLDVLVLIILNIQVKQEIMFFQLIIKKGPHQDGSHRLVPHRLVHS